VLLFGWWERLVRREILSPEDIKVAFEELIFKRIENLG